MTLLEWDALKYWNAKKIRN